MLYISDVTVSHNCKTRHLPDFCRVEIDDDKEIIIHEPEDEVLEINISKVGSIKFNFDDYRIKTFIGNCELIEIDGECDEYFKQIALKEEDLYEITIYKMLLKVFRFKIVRIDIDAEEPQFIAEIIVEQIEKENKRRDSEDRTDN